ENVLEKKQPDIVLAVENNIILSEINLINNITKVISKHDIVDTKRENYNLWRELRKQYEHQYRRISLTKPSDEYEFEANLRWMAAQGEGEDLIAIQKIKRQLPYNSELIAELIETAEKEIIEREREKDTIFGKYRIFVPKNEHLGKICTAIKLELVYKDFSVIIATEKTAKELIEFYPIELLAKFDDPQLIIEKSVNPEEGEIMQHYLVVKFDNPIPKNWKELIRNTRAEVVQSIGRSEAIVYADNEKIANQIKNLGEVIDVNKHKPKIPTQFQYLQTKSEKSLTDEEKKKKIAAARLQAARNPQEYHQKVIPIPGVLIASFFTEKDRDNAAYNLGQEGIHIANLPGKTKLTLDVNNYDNPLDTIEIIRHQIGLRSLKEKTVPTLFNNVARNLIAEKVIPSNPIPNDTSLGLTGEGEIVAVADSGLDTGNIETLHLDFEGRVNSIESIPVTKDFSNLVERFYYDDNDASDRHSGHGTHVAGSILGSGKQAKIFGESSVPKGIAPQAKLIFQAIEKTPKWTSEYIDFYRQKYGWNPPVSGLCGIPEHLNNLFETTYNRGARIHSNSWGGSVPGEYTQECEELDKFVWNHKDFLVVVAAGNEGKHSYSVRLGIDQGSVVAPAVAKNCLTVGASENNRQGQFPDTYGIKKPYNFPYPPFHDDNMVDYIDDIAAFSNRGPCEDGRRKPDLVAPGTFVLSTRSSQIADNNFADGCYSPAKDHYMYMSGTSMATPLVAGCAALVRQYLREKRNIKNPNAALVKATLIHSAQYMNYRYAHPNSAPWADNEQGWGRVNLCKVLNPELPTKVIFIDQSEGLATGDGHEYKVEITDATIPLRATLVYTDFPGDHEKEGRLEQLVNNLNLTLYPPSNKHRRYYQGNDFHNTGEIDNCNNVEGCIIEPDQVVTGIWTIKVVGSDVPEGPQDYALVVSGGNLEQV
ncbi:MAG: S8 family serine peptidase, partial [Cyanobacteria bacterium P01_F01_bin.143]